MSNRRSIYGLGFGSGLVIGAVLMQLMSAANESLPLDLATLEAEAARQGYQLVHENEPIKIVNETELRAVYITLDMTHDQIADLLTQAGLVDDRGQLLHELSQLPDDAVVQHGYYEFTKKPELAELILMITKNP